MSVPLPVNEPERLQALREYGLLDTPPEAVFDEIVALTSYVFHTPIAAIGLVDEKRFWLKARTGIDFTEAPREHAFSAHTILHPEGLVVPDTLADPRFASNPFVVGGLGIRFYAGIPLITREGQALGTLCILDTQPHPRFDAQQQRALQILGRHLMAQIEVRYSSAYLSRALLERNQAEAEAQSRILEHDRELGRINEMKDRFVTVLAHELRNPLASILNALEILRSPDPEDAVEIIEAQVRHLSRLIEDLLDLSRVTRGKLTLQKVPLDLAGAVRAAARAARPAFTKGGQRLVTDLPSDPLWVEADPVRLEQIVSNLLANSAKFTEAGKQVTLSLREESAKAVLRISDEGVGIPPEMLERIFEPFVQGDAARHRGGLGLGLPLVRQLVRLHHGSVEVRSEGAGRGCEFTVSFPLLAGPVSQEPSFDESDDGLDAPAPVSPPVRCRVLVVDDNADFRETLSRLLDRWGHKTVLLPSGAGALEKALQFHPDIALVDLGLPQMDGFAVAECLRRAPELAGMRLIAMSGYGEELERAHAAQSGFHDFLLKPVDPGFLRELLKTPAGDG